jgi:hypothetical protein
MKCLSSLPLTCSEFEKDFNFTNVTKYLPVVPLCEIGDECVQTRLQHASGTGKTNSLHENQRSLPYEDDSLLGYSAV